MRMQVFDENGTFLDMWPTGHKSRVYTHIVTEDDYVWVADDYTQRLIKYDLNGRYMLDIGEPGWLPGQFDGVHQISVDQEATCTLPQFPATARRSSARCRTRTPRSSSPRW